MRRLIIVAAALLMAAAAHAQTPQQQQLDAAVATASRIVVGMANQLTMDEQQLEQLRQQLVAVTAERDKLAAAKEAPEKPTVKR